MASGNLQFCQIWERLQPDAFGSLPGCGGYSASTFRDVDDAVDAGERDFFAKAAGPENFQLVDFGGGAEAKVQAQVGGRSIACTAEDIRTLAHATGGEEDFCTDCIAGGFVDLGIRCRSHGCPLTGHGVSAESRFGPARALGASSPNEFQRDPVVGVAHDVAKKRWPGIKVIEDNANVAVVEKIPEGRTASADDRGEAASSGGWNFLEFGPIETAKELRSLRRRRCDKEFCNRPKTSLGKERGGRRNCSRQGRCPWKPARGLLHLPRSRLGS